MPADILLLGFIAGFILYKLLSILGKRDDDMNIPINHKQVLREMIDISATSQEEAITDLSVIEESLVPKALTETVKQIRAMEPNFSLQKFLDGAKAAFEMILNAFAKNDRDTLKSLLDSNTYKQFTGEIDKRLKNKVNLELTLVAILEANIKNIQLEGKKILIDVFFKSQQINLLKDDKDVIVEGDPSQIDNMEDIWTFVRTIKSGPNWQLVKVNAN